MTEIYWLEQSFGQVPESNEWLSTGEAARLAALRFPKRRDDWRLGRWTAKQAVAAYLGLPSTHHRLAGLEIGHAPSGAPRVFLADWRIPVSISLSHRAGRALCAVTAGGGGLGCDLELIETRSVDFVEEYFTAEEQAFVERAASADRARLVTLLWSAKESVLKALETGLRASTRSVWVRLLEGGESGVWRRYCAHTSADTFQGWWCESEDLVRTVAVGPACESKQASACASGAMLVLP